MTSLPVGKHAVNLHDITVMTSLPVCVRFVTSLPVCVTSLPVGLKGRTRVRHCYFRFVTSLPVGLKGRTRVRHCYFRFVTSLPVGLKGRTRVRQCHFRFVTSLPVGKHAVHLHDIRVMTSLPVVRYFVTSLPVGFRGYTSPGVHIPEGTHPRGYTSPCPTTAEHTTYD